MALITVRPSKLDRWVAKAVTKHTDAVTERAAQVVTQGAGEHMLGLLVFWSSDVAGGIVVGAGLEQALRVVTGCGRAKNDGRQANKQIGRYAYINPSSRGSSP